MDEKPSPIIALSESECLERLRSQVLGRVVTRVGEVVDVFPVNFVLDAGEIVLRTAEGTKLSEMVISPEVLFQVDDSTGEEAWSVVVRGRARVLQTAAEIEEADALPLRPMVPTMKRNYVRIAPVSISGRVFEFGEEPSRDGPQEY